MTIAPVTLLTLGAGGLLCPCHMVSADAEVNGIPSALYPLEGEREGEVGEERMGRRRKGHTSRASSGSECIFYCHVPCKTLSVLSVPPNQHKGR